MFLASFVTAAQEQNYLIKKCESILPGDLFSSLEVSDVENKGTLNILAGTSYNGILYNFVYDPSTDCYNEWAAKSQYNTEGDVEDIVVRDADGDGKNEIILNGAKSKKQKQPDQYAFVLSMIGDQLMKRWGYKEDIGCGSSNTVDTADLYGLGEQAIIMGTEAKKVCALVNWSKNQRKILWISPVLDNAVQYVQAADFNGDGSIEIVVLTQNSRNVASVYLLSNTGQILWQKSIDGGVRVVESKNIWVDDLEGDGKFEILVGTQDHGIDVLDSLGSIKWNFKTASGAKADIVSKVRTYRYFTGDNRPKVVASAKPYIYVLDSRGNLLWKTTVNTTVFDFDYGDLDKDGKNDLVVGATSYIYIYSDTGRLKGLWSYVAEIQGLTGVFKKRDMDTVKVGVYDFDKDGTNEIVAAFNWFEDQLDMNSMQGSIRIFELNPDYRPVGTGGTEATQASTTVVETTRTDHQTAATTKATSQATQQTTATTLAGDGKKGGICPCIPALPGLLALGVALAFGVPLALRKKS